MAREILPGIHWIQECGRDRSEMFNLEGEGVDVGLEVHLPQNAYLFVGQETLLFDTLSPASKETIIEEVNAVLGERDLDYVMVSHPDVPHAGNTPALLRAYPDATVIAPEYGSGHELYRLDDAIHVSESDTIDLGEHIVEFHEATFPDAAVSVWMTEQTTGSLLPVDWLGFPHYDDECTECAEELDRDVGRDRLVEFHGRVLFWYQYVDVAKTQAEINHLIEKFDPEAILPAHGLPIREDTTEHMRRVKDAVKHIDAEGRVGILG